MPARVACDLIWRLRALPAFAVTYDLAIGNSDRINDTPMRPISEFAAP